MKVVTTRIEEEYFNDLVKIEKQEKNDRSEIIRKLLANGINEWEIKNALGLLKDHKITFRKASEIANLTYSQIVDLASKSGIDIGYSLIDLQKDCQKR